MASALTLAEKVVESLREFRDDLRRGERIVVRTIEQCGCESERLSKHQTRCHICNGRGFVVDAFTFLPEDES